MAENLSNDIQALLNGAISNVATAITTTGSTGFPAVNFRVRVDDEIMLVTSVGGGTNWTVTRGIESTVAVAHSNSTPVVHVLTAGGLAQFVQERALSVPTRQTTVIGALSTGYANSLSTGTGLAVNLSATASPLVVAFAAGFDTRGDIDFVSQLTADVTGVVSSLPANNTSYISATYIDAASVTWNQTLNPPQYGYTYDRTKQSLLRFAGADASTSIIDDYGNTWAAVGNAQIDTAVQIDTLNTLLCDGTGDYVECTQFISFGSGSWEYEFKVRWNTLPTAGQFQTLVHFAPAANAFGTAISLNNAAGVFKLAFHASSNNGAFDIANGSLGTSTTWATATTYHIKVCYDALAGKYFVYKDGVQDFTVTSAARISGLGRCRIGSGALLTVADFNGAIAGFRMAPYCRSPNGTTFTAPTISTFAVEGDYFSIPQMTMYSVTSASGSAGVDPGMTAVNKVYVGECDTGAATVTAVRNYAYQGKYESVPITPVLATLTSNNHNLGVIPKDVKISFICYTTDTVWTPGEEIISEGTHTSNNTSNGILASCTRTVLATIVGATNIALLGKTTGVGLVITLANWKYKTYVNRGW